MANYTLLRTKYIPQIAEATPNYKIIIEEMEDGGGSSDEEFVWIIENGAVLYQANVAGHMKPDDPEGFARTAAKYVNASIINECAKYKLKDVPEPEEGWAEHIAAGKWDKKLTEDIVGVMAMAIESALVDDICPAAADAAFVFHRDKFCQTKGSDTGCVEAAMGAVPVGKRNTGQAGQYEQLTKSGKAKRA